MSPPELARDAPRPDVLHPVEVDLRRLLGEKAHAPILDDVDRRLGELVHPHEPLQRHERLDPLAGAMRERHRVAVLLGARDQPPIAQLLHHRTPRIGDRQTREVLSRVGGHAAVLADRGELRQPMSAPDLEVIRVVTGGDLQRSRAEIGADVLIRDDLQRPSHDREHGRLADQPAIPVVLGVHRDRGVGQHRLGTDGRDRDRSRAGRQGVIDVIQRVRHLAILDLQVGDRRAASRVPVDHVAIAVDEVFVVERHEYLDYRLGIPLVEREALVLVVARGTEALELLDDRVAVLLAPLPHPRHERLASDLFAARTFLLEGALHLSLRRDPRVVGAEDPLRPPPLHAVVTHEAVLDRVVERVPHVQHAGHVRRRDGDRVVLLGRAPRLGMEQTRLEPSTHDSRLNLSGVVAGLGLEIGHGGVEIRHWG